MSGFRAVIGIERARPLKKEGIQASPGHLRRKESKQAINSLVSSFFLT